MATVKEIVTNRITYPIEPDTKCTCLRLLAKPHCPYCGYATVRACPSQANVARWPNGDIWWNMTYACRKCGQYFDDLRRTTQCIAAQQKLGRPLATKDAPLKYDSLDDAPDEAREALAKLMQLRAARGEAPPTPKSKTDEERLDDMIKTFTAVADTEIKKKG